MTNHPNRNWRARMRASADQWITTSEARCLIEIPIRKGEHETAMQKRIRQAYEAGYKDGRKTK